MEREIRLEINELEHALRKAGVIEDDEFVKSVHIEPSELIIKVEDDSAPVREKGEANVNKRVYRQN